MEFMEPSVQRLQAGILKERGLSSGPGVSPPLPDPLQTPPVLVLRSNEDPRPPSLRGWGSKALNSCHFRVCVLGLIPGLCQLTPGVHVLEPGVWLVQALVPAPGTCLAPLGLGC